MKNLIYKICGLLRREVNSSNVLISGEISGSEAEGVSNFSQRNVNQERLYYLDIDSDQRLFVRYIHVTSSINAERIMNSGLKPFNNVRSTLANYLEKVFPGRDGSEMLEDIEKSPNREISSMVTMRLSEEKNGLGYIFLLPLGSKHYLQGAVNNGLTDGGEIFMAARKTLNKMYRLNHQGLFPDATPIVFVVRHYLEGTFPILKFKDLEDIQLDLGDALATNFMGENWGTFNTEIEIRHRGSYQYADLEKMELNEYFTREKLPVSPSAAVHIKTLFENKSNSLQQ